MTRRRATRPPSNHRVAGRRLQPASPPRAEVLQVTVVVPAVSSMSDETFINHLEARHADALRMRWIGRYGKQMAARSTWELYHEWLHKHEDFDHRHRESA